MRKVGKGLFAENDEEAVYWQTAGETKAFIKQLQASIKRSQADLKLSAREVHQKFIAGCKANIKTRKLDIKIKRQFLKFCESHISPIKGKV